MTEQTEQTPAWPSKLCGTCGKPIIWAVTSARGKAIPVNAGPADPGIGNLALTPQYRLDPTTLQRVDDYTKPPVATVVKETFGRRLYLSHFVDCPQADQWRRPR